jgi:diguanylate cyclase (GGDEF)-like protein/PAS domain S-box-containing protein
MTLLTTWSAQNQHTWPVRARRLGLLALVLGTLALQLAWGEGWSSDQGAAGFWERYELPARFIALLALLAALSASALLWRQNRSLLGITAKYRETALNLRVAATAFEGQQGLLVADAKARVLRANRSFLQMTSYREDEVIGKSISLFHSDLEEPRFLAKLYAHLTTSHAWSGEVWCRCKDGTSVPCWSTVTAVLDDDGDAVRYVGAFTDVSQRKKVEAEVLQLAFYDTVTELPNRRLFLDRLSQAALACTRNDTRGAVFFIDLDNFKSLNDTHGHAVGDELLRQVALRLGRVLRSSDTLARLGGDEFVVMLTNLDTDLMLASTQASCVAQTMLERVRQPYRLRSIPTDDGPVEGELLTYTCSASIGVTLFGDVEMSVDEIMLRADAAMYQSKRGGRDAVSHFDPELQLALSQRSQLSTDLHQALSLRELSVHYQLQTDARCRAVGAELLLRWTHPQRGAVPPDVFIPIAEESGKIVAMGYWVLQSACETLVRWAQSPHTETLELAVNLSPRQFIQPDFALQLERLLERTGANPKRLMLEITEGLILGQTELAIQKMQAICALGVSFSVDDFGTGYSSLAYLQRLPLKQLKIDRVFVRDLDNSPNDQAIVRTILSLGKSLGLQVVAEGVETLAQQNRLADAGCDVLQGFLLGRPMPLADFEKSLAVMQSLDRETVA